MAPDPIESGTPLILYDGVCNLCNRWVRFVLRHEREPRCRFVPLASEPGRRLLAEHGLDAQPPDSVVYIQDDRVEVRSRAALAIAAHLRAPFRWGGILRIVPRPIADAVYRWIAKHRYRMFGRSDRCPMPHPEHRGRFLGLDEEVQGSRP